MVTISRPWRGKKATWEEKVLVEAHAHKSPLSHARQWPRISDLLLLLGKRLSFVFNSDGLVEFRASILAVEGEKY